MAGADREMAAAQHRRALRLRSRSGQPVLPGSRCRPGGRFSGEGGRRLPVGEILMMIQPPIEMRRTDSQWKPLTGSLDAEGAPLHHVDGIDRKDRGLPRESPGRCS